MLMGITELDPLYARVFEDPKNGTPNNITLEGCMTLAQLGKDAWNAWRQQYPVTINDSDEYQHYENIALFICNDFRGTSISFDGFEFGHGANFSRAIFNVAYFKNTKFGDNACFSDVSFDEFPASFDKAEFGNEANFTCAQFGEDTSFEGAKFGNKAKFVGAQFDKGAFFAGTKFGSYASFAGAQFGDNASFFGAEFGDNLSFASLSWASLRKYSTSPQRVGSTKVWAEERGLSPEIFKSISFAGVNFIGRVDFSGRKFEGRTSFGRLPCQVEIFRYNPDGKVVSQLLPEGKSVQFGKAPLFHNCKLHPDTTFDGDDQQFPKPSSNLSENDTAARAYRTLKLAFSQHQATHEEQRFFRLEMAEEEKRSSFRLRLLFGAYRFLSCYGFSLIRPMFLLLLFPLLIFAMIYSWLAELTLCFLWLDELCHIRIDFLKFSLMQTFPLPGLDKWSDSLRQYLFPEQGLGLTFLGVCRS